MDAHNATFGLVIFIIVVALVFDYTNGFHDAANSIATVVATRVFSPGVAVVWASFFNFIAVVVFGTAVAKTVGGDMVDISKIPPSDQLYVLLAGVLGAIFWNLITWYFGLPTSSSHASSGAYAGVGSRVLCLAFWNGRHARRAQARGLDKDTGLHHPFTDDRHAAWLCADGVVYWIFHRVSVRRVDRVFRIGQLFSAAAYSLGHGGNDAQKTMGIITIVLVAGGYLQMTPEGKLPDIPLWVELLPAERSHSEHCPADGASSKRWAPRS